MDTNTELAPKTDTKRRDFLPKNRKNRLYGIQMDTIRIRKTMELF